ncbi:MAG: clostripain-related cysteine peptidase [Elusimicrobiales bacterium]|nr:clostripain-related cysteine peptidase [Elusimicrobiales bacterium]
MTKLFAALLCCGMVNGAVAAVTFDQQGSVTEIVSQLQNVSPDAAVVPLPGDPKALAKWTVMVYVNAKNNLESYGLKDVNEMEMVGSTPELNIVAELGRINGYATNDGDWKGSRRYLVQKDADTSKITSPVVMEIPKSDMGNWKNLVEFVKWSKTNYPAQRYVLVVWNHGSGWNKNAAAESGKGISYDDETGSHITTQQLKQALDETGKMEILSMDACLMQMMEVAYEARTGADYIVASEETEPGDGYTYNTWLAPLAAKPSMTQAELSKAMVDSYTDHYQSINQGATQSSVKTENLYRLGQLTNAWVTAVMASGETLNAKNARTKAQAFYYSSNKDLGHFVKLLNDGTQNADVKARGTELLSFLNGSVIYHNRAFGAKYANATGLAIYMPTSYTAAYDGLQWAKDSNWDDFTKWIK